MKGIVFVFVVLIVVCSVRGHTCSGTIINNSKLNWTLATTDVVHGSLSQIPATELNAFESTTFIIESNFGVNDRIEYKFGYIPLYTWCNDVYSGNDDLELTGEFKYTYGDIDCSGSTITCSNNSNTTLIYQNCNGVWDTSNPTFNIFYES